MSIPHASMEMVFKGHILKERNPAFLEENETLGNNSIKHVVLTMFDDECAKIRTLIGQYNDSKPIEQRYSFPVAFEQIKMARLSCHTKLIIRAAKSDSLMKLIDWSSPLLQKQPVQWLGMELEIRVRVVKYNFTSSSSSASADAEEEELLSGGTARKMKGVSFQIKNIKIVGQA